MRQIGAFEAKNTLGTLLDEVERGGEVVITRRGKPVAHLGPARPVKCRAEAIAAMRRIRDRAEVLGLELTVDQILALRDEGRK